jgi:hypothetical protein
MVGEPQPRRLDVLAGAEVAAGEVDAAAVGPRPIGIGRDVEGVVAAVAGIPDL